MGGTKRRNRTKYVQVSTEVKRAEINDKEMEQGGVWKHIFR